MPASPPLAAHGLVRRYGELEALHPLDLEVAAGSVVALVGHNGSGKTTAIRTLCGLLVPDAGRVLVAGHDIHGGADAVAACRALAFVPDSPVLYDDLTVREHLELVGAAHGVPTDERDGRAADLLARLDLEERAEFVPRALSRGMRQKVQIACAFVRPFSVLVLDEPVVGLDPPTQATLAGLLRGAADDGAAVLFSTHQLAFAGGIADRALILDDGALVDDGPFATVVAGPRARALALA